MDNVPTSAFFNMLMNLAGGMIEKWPPNLPRTMPQR